MYRRCLSYIVHRERLQAVWGRVSGTMSQVPVFVSWQKEKKEHKMSLYFGSSETSSQGSGVVLVLVQPKDSPWSFFYSSRGNESEGTKVHVYNEADMNQRCTVTNQQRLHRTGRNSSVESAAVAFCLGLKNSRNPYLWDVEPLPLLPRSG